MAISPVKALICPLKSIEQALLDARTEFLRKDLIETIIQLEELRIDGSTFQIPPVEVKTNSLSQDDLEVMDIFEQFFDFVD